MAGNTEVGIETKFKHVPLPVILSPTGVPELGGVRLTEQVGGRVGVSAFVLDWGGGTDWCTHLVLIG